MVQLSSVSADDYIMLSQCTFPNHSRGMRHCLHISSDFPLDTKRPKPGGGRDLKQTQKGLMDVDR